jgi:pyruvate,water dikinase
MFEAFLAEFGDRNGSGWGSDVLLTAPTWRDQPLQVIRLAAKYLGDHVIPPGQQRDRARVAAQSEVEALCTQCSDPETAELFQVQLGYARQCQAVVEIHNHHIEQVGLGQLRRAVLAAARHLGAAGVLDEPDDVFWLTFAEILDALRHPEPLPLSNAVLERKEAYSGWKRLEPPPCLGLPPFVLPLRRPDREPATQQEAGTPGELTGIGASAGVVRGRARVIMTWQADPELEPGDILVAENAGPAWLPFFPILSGMVLETGSLGQHAASTAREYGLPAVMAVCGAIRRIHDGDWITVNGTTGVVKMDRPA